MTNASGMTLAPLKDEDLVVAARRGDERAFEELYERYRPKIRAFALRLTHDPHRADDITQEVFISALRRLRQSDRPIAFRPWIYEIARNACIDDYRRARRSHEVPIELDGTDHWLQGLATAPPPEVAVESRQQLDHLRGAFRSLSERHHRIIVLRELEGLSYSQIGDELGMSKIVVESTLFRARRRLSEEYEDLSSGRRCEHVRRMLHDDVAQPVRRLGLRERRALSSHLEHCGSCRREAAAAGLDGRLRDSKAMAPAAALIPFPILLRLLRRAGGSVAAAGRAVHHLALPAASWSGCAGSVAAAAADGRIAATAATVLAAAVGGGVLTGLGQSSPAAAHRIVHAGPASSSRGAGQVTATGRGATGILGPRTGSTPVSRGSAGSGRAGAAGASATGAAGKAGSTAGASVAGSRTGSASGAPGGPTGPSGSTGASGGTTASGRSGAGPVPTPGPSPAPASSLSAAGVSGSGSVSGGSISGSGSVAVPSAPAPTLPAAPSSGSVAPSGVSAVSSTQPPSVTSSGQVTSTAGSTLTSLKRSA